MTKTKPKFRSRYPILLPPPEHATPRWERIAKQVEANPNRFVVRDLGRGLREVTLKDDEAYTALIHAMIKTMTSPHHEYTILEIDPLQTISPMLRSLWTGRGYTVEDRGVITIEAGNGQVYQYPFITILDTLLQPSTVSEASNV